MKPNGPREREGTCFPTDRRRIEKALGYCEHSSPSCFQILKIVCLYETMSAKPPFMSGSAESSSEADHLSLPTYTPLPKPILNQLRSMEHQQLLEEHLLKML